MAGHDYASGRLLPRVLNGVYCSGLGARLIPTPPAGRMLTSVDRQHDHRCISRAKVHRVREARHHGTTRLSMNARKVKRTGRNAFDDSVQLLAELSPQAETPGLIPLAHFECLVFGLWPEDNVQRHFNLGA